ncbi:MAG: rRNA maturation RNase YbeY, partial [Proteobacteria bacterium]|nr:rRNA maturation RNase YbeY [Pseudomonadota bacterium]
MHYLILKNPGILNPQKRRVKLVLTICISCPSSFPASFQARIRKAIRTTLSQLPKTVTRKTIKRGQKIMVSVSIVGTEIVRKLNRGYRGKNKPTDVLSFSRIEADSPEIPILDIGDLVICLPIAKRQAKEYGESLGRELERLTVHGMLHLFGYDHERSLADERKMFQLQNKIL